MAMNHHRSVLCCFLVLARRKKALPACYQVGSPAGFVRAPNPVSRTRVATILVSPKAITEWGTARFDSLKQPPGQRKDCRRFSKLLSDILKDLKCRCPASYLQREIAGPAGYTSKLVPATLAGCVLATARIYTPKVVRESCLCAVGRKIVRKLGLRTVCREVVGKPSS